MNRYDIATGCKYNPKPETPPKPKKKRRHRCESCNRLKDDVTYGPNPYQQEINDDPTPCWMCGDCRFESAMDI